MTAMPPSPATVQERLPEPLMEAVLERLNLAGGNREPSMQTLRAVYASWCRRVPFDNIRKLIHIRSENPAFLPGYNAEDFFQAWLRHGTGATCWGNARALHALLHSLEFEAERGISTMLVNPQVPPNHGMVVVTLDEQRLFVDGSIMYGEPLLLDETCETQVVHPAWGVRCSKRDGHWHVQWRPLHKTDGFECRIDSLGGATDADYHERYERTREWSPFNYQINARINRGDEVIGLAYGKAITLRSDGRVTAEPFSKEERDRRLIEEMGYSEEIVSQIPDDIPTPPLPGSRTAMALGS